MSIPIQSLPPDARANYIIDQLEGERLTLPGSKGAFRILASSKQTDGGIAVFQSGAVLSDAPGFHWHEEAHDVFLVTKGYLKLWGGDKCRILGPGDFAYVPPKVIHNPELLGPHTEMLGLVAPGDWIDFFRYVGETYSGALVPENDNRDLRSMLIPKLMEAKDRFDVHFERDYTPPELSDWLDTENVLAGPLETYFLRANTGPRWMLGGVMSRPFINASQCSGKFAITSIESSSVYGKSSFPQWLTFPNIDHCFCVMEGLLKVKIQGEGENWSEVREGQTLVIAAGQTFSLEFASRYVRAITFTNGSGLGEFIQTAGSSYTGFVLPDSVETWDQSQLETPYTKVNVHAPVSEVQTHVGDAPAVVSEVSAPVSEVQAHVGDAPAVVSEVSAPDSEVPAPVSKVSAPVSEVQAPVSEVPAPVSEVQAPVSTLQSVT